jgi:hypothetical protein
VYTYAFDLIADELHLTFAEFGPWNSTVYRYATIPYVAGVISHYNYSYLRSSAGKIRATDELHAGFSAALTAIHAQLVPSTFEITLLTDQSSQ